MSGSAAGGFGFTCSYTRLRDVEGDAPCGRAATKRAQGSPKCMGHWPADFLLDILGRTEHARRTWLCASYLLFFCGVQGVLTWGPTFNNYAFVTCALTLFSAGVFVITWREHPAGGWLALVSGPVLGFYLLGNGVSVVREYLWRHHAVPKGSGLTTELVAAATDFGTGVVFFGTSVGFFFYYFKDDVRELRFWTGLNLPLAVLALPGVVAVTLLTGGAYLWLRPWFAVVFVAAFVARGRERIRQLAQRLRV